MDELADVALELRRYLAWVEADGTRTLLKVPGPGAAESRPAAAHATQPSAAQPSAGQPAARAPAQRPAVQAPAPTASAGPSAAVTALGTTLDEIRQTLGACERCKLCKGRTQIVFGVGNPKAELVFVGEGPGEQEDLQGIPFVGAAGQLLTKMIEAMKFQRDEVYICNVVKCRPPGNRNPEPDEIAACEPFLKAQLAALKPKVIVALGKFAAQTLLRDATPITRLRGRWREYEGIPLMPTYHPAYLLRTPGEKKLAWLDLQDVMRRFGKLEK